MTFNPAQRQRVARYLSAFDFVNLFFEELGWDEPPPGLRPEIHTLEDTTYTFRRVSHKRDFYLFVCEADDGRLPDSGRRSQLETWLSKRNREHITIYLDGHRREQVWSWARREPGRPVRRFFHRYNKGQPGESLIQRLEQLEVTLAEEDDVTLVDVSSRVRAAFNVERATKKFYDQFKKEHTAFETFVLGIPDVDMSKWYVSVMLNRLMFVYFIQRKGFLDGDRDYLRHRLRRMQQQYGDDQFYSFYRYFLLRLFHEGLGEPHHDDELEGLIGKVPYLNGGIFQLHAVEQLYPDIQISDDAFTRIFDFFDQYQWHLDDRPLHDDSEINPDVLGYIFEKYINQKQMGAYYTKEDITEYISKNTIIPFLFEAAQKECAVAFSGEQSVWRLAQADPDRYIYTAIRKGTELPLPDDIAVGVADVSQRDTWNTPTPDEYALPTEIWRETVARRQRYETVKAQLAAGEVHSINAFITHNLDIQQLAQDVIENSEGPELLRAFWRAINRVSVLDPTCGSGAFLFAALNILQPLYEACLERMADFVADLGPEDNAQKYSDFKRVLAQVAQHPNQDYYVLKSIVVNNLYGVDIMPEAVEIAKLRLFLKLVAQVETAAQIEPLPDIDFNIRAGNTLVGFTSKAEVAKAMQTTQAGQGRLLFGEDQAALAAIEEKAGDVDRLFARFRAMQTSGDLHDFDAADFVVTKQRLQARLQELDDELNQLLARQYGVNPNDKQAYQKWLTSHQPFHWFTEFYGILNQGGFDVIIGNPPYVEYHKIRKVYQLQSYSTLECGNMYTFVMEQSFSLLHLDGRSGFITPLSLVCTNRMEEARNLLKNRKAWSACFDMRPSSLFEGVAQRLCIILTRESVQGSSETFTGGYKRWTSEERKHLLMQIMYVKNENRAGENIPKLEDETEVNILKKISGPSIEKFKQKGNQPIYIHRIVRYFIKALDFVPLYIDGKGNKGKSDDYKSFHFQASERSAIIALLNSSLFYWFWRSHSDGFHCGYGDVFQMPYKKIPTENKKRLELLQKNLMSKLKETSTIKTITTKKGSIQYQEFSSKSTKPIIDAIEMILAEHYGFTDEELDFIINYDIKYRLGDDLFDEEEEA